MLNKFDTKQIAMTTAERTILLFLTTNLFEKILKYKQRFVQYFVQNSKIISHSAKSDKKIIASVSPITGALCHDNDKSYRRHKKNAIYLVVERYALIQKLFAKI